MTEIDVLNNIVSMAVTGSEDCSFQIPAYKVKVASTVRFSEALA